MCLEEDVKYQCIVMRIYAAESYIGLVEVGVGLLPGGGGTKEFALRASNDFFDGDVQTQPINISSQLQQPQYPLQLMKHMT